MDVVAIVGLWWWCQEGAMAVEMRSNIGGRGGDNNNDKGYGGDGGRGYGGDGNCRDDCSGAIMVLVLTVTVKSWCF